jgi:hypothetical protein
MEESKKTTDSASSSPFQGLGFESATAAAAVQAMVSTPEQQGPSSWLDTTAAKVGGALFAIAATAVTARDAISRAFFKTVNKGKEGAFADLQEIRDAEYNSISKAARGVAGWEHGTAVADAPKRMAEVSKKYDGALKKRREMLGFNNVWDEAKVLKKHQWLEVGFATAAVASVAVGAIMAIASARGKSKKLEEHLEKNQNPQVR